MRICVPRETYPLERRVMVLPSSAKSMVDAGHELFVQAGAGVGINIQDSEYSGVGARIVADAANLYNSAGMIIKLKAPSPEEYSLMNDAILFAMIHSEQNPEQIYYAGKQGLLVVQMEKVVDNKNQRLIDQCDMTGEAGVLYALNHCQRTPSDIRAVILGYGRVAQGAIDTCARLGMDWKVMRKSELKHIPQYLQETDLLINAIAWPKKKRQQKAYIVTREDIKKSKPSMVILDLAVDFPTPIETCRPTTYSNPFYIDEGHIHIGIYGYPGLFPVSSARIYSGQVLPLALTIANRGGLEGIEGDGEIGKAISRGILDPTKHRWKMYEPKGPVGSNIE